jgi:outer membrane protein TolC
MLYVFFLVFVLMAAPAGAQETMTLEQCLKTGLTNNPSLQASKFMVDSAGSDIKMARADLLPSISSSYSANTIFATEASGPADQDYLDQNIHAFNIKLTQILYAGSRIVNTYERAKILKQVSEAEMHLARVELAYNIETTFYKLMKAKEDIISATESVNRLEESVKSAEAFLEKELVPYVDVLKAQVDLADARDQLGQAKNNGNRQREALFALMDLPVDPSLEFVSGDYDLVREIPSFTERFQYAVDNRPDLQSLEYQFQAANKQQSIATGKYLPTASFDIGYYNRHNDYDNLRETNFGTTDLDQTNKYMMAGITLSWNMFDGGRAYYEKEKYTLEARRVRALIQDTRNMISTGIRQALYSMSEASQRLVSSADALIAAEENYTSEEKRLKAGISTIQTLLDAQGRLIRAQGNKSNAALDYQLAKSELKLMTGGDRLQDNFN